MPEPVAPQVTRLAMAVLDALDGSDDATALMIARCDLVRAAAELRVAIDSLEAAAIKVWPFGGGQVVEVPHEGQYALGKSGQRVTWDHPRAGAAVTKAWFDRDAIHHPQDVTERILATQTAPSGWRIEVLKRLALDVERFRTVEGGHLIIRPAGY